MAGIPAACLVAWLETTRDNTSTQSIIMVALLINTENVSFSALFSERGGHICGMLWSVLPQKVTPHVFVRLWVREGRTI